MRLADGVTAAAHDEQHQQVLREAGLRVTAQRVAVLDAVRRLPHADTDSLINAVRAETGDISHQAVYDVLKVLTDARLVRQDPAAGPGGALRGAGSATTTTTSVCRGCGTIADVDCAVGDTPCLTASESNGFVIDEAEVIYWGTCPDCTTSTASA